MIAEFQVELSGLPFIRNFIDWKNTPQIKDQPPFSGTEAEGQDILIRNLFLLGTPSLALAIACGLVYKFPL